MRGGSRDETQLWTIRNTRTRCVCGAILLTKCKYTLREGAAVRSLSGFIPEDWGLISTVFSA